MQRKELTPRLGIHNICDLLEAMRQLNKSCTCLHLRLEIGGGGGGGSARTANEGTALDVCDSSLESFTSQLDDVIGFNSLPGKHIAMKTCMKPCAGMSGAIGNPTFPKVGLQ